MACARGNAVFGQIDVTVVEEKEAVLFHLPPSQQTLDKG